MKAKKFVAGSALALAATASQAAVPVSVSTALSDGLTDVSTIGSGGLVIVIAVAVYRYMKRAA